MSTFTIVDANPNGTVKVKYSIDGKTQCLSNMPVDDADALTASLTDYGVAYEAGFATVAPVEVDADVTALVGKKVEMVEAEAVVTE